MSTKTRKVTPTHQFRRKRHAPVKRKGSEPSRASHATTFPIVGIGASAGGLSAFSDLLNVLPRKTGMAFVIISHLEPTHPSMLDTLLAKKSKMPVQQAANGTATKPDHVYVIQPNKSGVRALCGHVASECAMRFASALPARRRRT